MHSEASSSQPTMDLRGSGALSHVYVQYPPLRCNISGTKGIFYDDGSKLLISPTSDQVFSWKVAPFDPSGEPLSDPVSEGPVLSVRYSLDSKILAVQRSNYEIQFWDKERGTTFHHRFSSESERILGFFWTDCPTCNVVLVKTSGIDLMNCDSESQIVRLIESKRSNVSWYVYTHESRLLLLASGMQCKSFTGFQLSSAGIIRLPKFEMLMGKSEANNKPVLAAEDVHVITVYGRIYCLQVDRVVMQLHCYRFYRDAVVQQGSLPLYSSKVSMSVIDNLLLVHQVDAKVVIMYDLFADSSAPISAPLPMLLRGYPRASFSSFQNNSKVSGNPELKETDDDEATVYKNGWTFLNPDLICDTTCGLLWKIHLDLDAIAASSSDVPSVLEFLQRRKLEANKAKRLCLALAKAIILEHRQVTIVARAMDILITSYSYALKTGNYFKAVKTEKSLDSNAQHGSSPRISADEFSGRGYKREELDIVGSGAIVRNETIKRSSTISDSDSEELNVAPSSVSDKLFMNADSSVGKIPLTSSQSQLPGSSCVSLGANDAEEHESQATTAAISPDEVYSFVFAPADEEMEGNADYLVTVIIEFLRSASLERIRVYPNIYVLMIQLLAHVERYAELSSYIIDKIIEPSKEVAYQLLESGAQHLPTRKLGIDMLRQLGLHHDYVSSLVENGYYQEGLRYARKHKVVTVRPTLFLEKAFASNDSQRLGAVLRFISDFMPLFKGTPDYATYCQILTQMNAFFVTA